MRQFAWIAAVLAISTGAFAAFAPRTASECAHALGDLKEVPAEFRRLLVADSDFDLIPFPERGDWLAVHPEPGQSFASFLAARPNRPTAERCVIYLLPIGDVAKGSDFSLETVRRFAAVFFQMEVKILPTYEPASMEFEPRVNPNTRQVQLLTTSILKFLGKRLPPDAFCLLGVTLQDLYPAPSWNYVFGQASLWERVGIYSFARYDPDFFGDRRPDDHHRLILLRGCKVLAHETGHMFGMQHCIYYNCVLNGSNSLAETDAQTIQLCPICLRKLQSCISFDAVQRYRELARFYAKQDLPSESDWCERQVAKANQP